MGKRHQPWLFYCRGCDLWRSSLDMLNEKTAPIYIYRELEGLRQLRVNNSNVILEALSRFGTLDGLELLDVGCSYGWFMEVARKRGIIPHGLDYQKEKAEKAIANGLDIKTGYFPEDVESSKRYDIIAFNDVLEHFKDVDRALKSSRKFMRDGGKLIIAYPDSNGFYYRLALLLFLLGWKAPFFRMWQKGYPSPHLYYFNSRNLEKLVSSYGFRLIEDREVPTYTLKGIWGRIHVDKKRPSLFSVLLYISVMAVSLTVQRLFKSDFRFHIYQKLPG